MKLGDGGIGVLSDRYLSAACLTCRVIVLMPNHTAIDRSSYTAINIPPFTNEII